MASVSPCFGAVKVGVGETIITPPVGIPLYGYSPRLSDGVHDDLHARSLVIEGDQGTTAVLMTLALEWISPSLFSAVREGIQQQTGIPAQNIIISATHTHSGPEFQPPDHPYSKMLIERSVESAVIAWKNRVPGKIGFGASAAREMGMNDRRMQYGGVHADPEVNIIKVEDARGKLLGVAFNYGCHPSVLDKYNYKITEDWPYYSIRGIRKKVGKNVWVAFYQSAQGDAKVGYSAEYSAIGAEMNIRTFEFAEYKGNMIVDAVMNVLSSINTSSSPDVAVTEKSFDFPAREGYRLTVGEAQKQADAAKAAMVSAEKRTDIYGKRVIEAFRVENYLAGLRLNAAKTYNAPNRPQVIPLLQQAVRIGDAVFVTFPCEVFTEIGLKVKQQSPLEKTFVLGCAGCFDEYLPTAEEFREEGYAALISPFSPQAEQALIEYSLELIGAVMKP
ncbi:MAG: neutral/alkaline non-lysosomal ceramidase N-terminal domain-containing protein, partial [Candidatus Latescibacterota bacterium]